MSTYDHLNAELESYYSGKGIEIQVDPPGRGAPDILGKHSNGSTFVGEIKSDREASGSASSWWSHWTKPERDLQPHYSDEPPSATRGWCAVIDGQLREYCDRQGISEGDLVVEQGGEHASAIEDALAFLSGQARASKRATASSGKLHFWTISFV